VADPVSQQFHRLDEAGVLDLLHEGVDVATLPATEAMEEAVVGPDVEGRRLLIVKRAQTLQRVRAGAPELHIVTDHILDSDTFADGGDVAIGDTAWHWVSLERALRLAP
jgi:hypothetical protein